MNRSSFAIDVPAALLDRARRGDSHAFEQIYRLFERPVYNLAWRMLNDAEEAQEILHDAMLTLFGKIAQFRGDAPFWGWLRQIAINEAFDADFANDPIDNCNVTNRQLRLVALIRQAQAGANFCLERMEVGHV